MFSYICNYILYFYLPLSHHLSLTSYPALCAAPAHDAPCDAPHCMPCCIVSHQVVPCVAPPVECAMCHPTCCLPCVVPCIAPSVTHHPYHTVCRLHHVMLPITCAVCCAAYHAICCLHCIMLPITCTVCHTAHHLSPVSCHMLPALCCTVHHLHCLSHHPSPVLCISNVSWLLKNS